MKILISRDCSSIFFIYAKCHLMNVFPSMFPVCFEICFSCLVVLRWSVERCPHWYAGEIPSCLNIVLKIEKKIISITENVSILFEEHYIKTRLAALGALYYLVLWYHEVHITKTRPCNIQQYFTAVKMIIFR